MKNFIQWNYERGTWQYDVFCLLIIAFIFLTPKAWFDKRERLATQTARLVVKATVLPLDEKKNADGEVFYEIDTRLENSKFQISNSR